jgi:hypothetical protein
MYFEMGYRNCTEIFEIMNLNGSNLGYIGNKKMFFAGMAYAVNLDIINTIGVLSICTDNELSLILFEAMRSNNIWVANLLKPYYK